MSFGSALFLCTLLVCLTAWAQTQSPDKTTTEAKVEAPKDTLGRESPRNAVLGFLNATRKGHDEIAVLYLNTPLRGESARTLAHQLAVVLNRKLPARLNAISDKPEGSIPDPLKPNEDLIGTIRTANGDLDIKVERVDRGKMGLVWMFSKQTLEDIPEVYGELETPPIEQILPSFLVSTRFADIPLFEWLAVFIGIPGVFLLTGILNRVLGAAVGAIRRRFLRSPHAGNPRVLSPPSRILIVAGIIFSLLSRVGLPLLARQFWSTTVRALVVVACVWLLLIFNGICERYLLRRKRDMSGSAAVLRLLRRGADALVIVASILLCLHHFDVNITAALAGLGVGGIAVALAAQKTLENVIAGVSLIADHAVRVGDTLKVGDVTGTVEEVGLRSTRIRKVDRTLVVVPNSQIASMTVEALSARDKLLFHHVIGLLYDTTPGQLNSIVASFRNVLVRDFRIETESVRVRILRLGPYSIDVEVFAYVTGRDWNHFLEVQEELLVSLKTKVEQAGAEIAFPSQTMYLVGESLSANLDANANGIQHQTRKLR